MNDQDLRQLVRQAVARQLGHGTPLAGSAALPPAPAALPPNSGVRDSVWSRHPSHYLFLTVVNSGDACVIEPSVTCDHCGYCKSHGH
jgi:hypothetical protein